MDISTKHPKVTILSDKKVAKVKKHTLINDKQYLIIHYKFINDPRLNCFITHAEYLY